MKINCYKESCQLALEARLKQAPRPKSDDNLEVFCDHGLLDPRTHTVTFNKSPYGGAFATTILISYWHFPGKSDFEVFQKVFLFKAFVAPLIRPSSCCKVFASNSKGKGRRCLLKSGCQTRH